MDFSTLIGFKSTTQLLPESFLKCYYDLPDDHWERIKQASLDLAKAKIGPAVLNIIEDDDNHRCLEYQQVIPFDAYNPNLRPNLTNEEIIDQITILIATMHKLGYGHGDLHISNLGFIGDKIYILDHDTVYRIGDGPVPWLQTWMEDGFDWEGSFEEFVANDYDTWRSDWLQ